MPEAVLDEEALDEARGLCRKYFQRTLSDGNLERLLQSMTLEELDSILSNLAMEKNTLPTLMHIYAERKRIRLEKENRERKQAGRHDQTPDERLAIWWYLVNSRVVQLLPAGAEKMDQQKFWNKWFLGTVAGIRLKHGQQKFTRVPAAVRSDAEFVVQNYDGIMQEVRENLEKAVPEWKGRLDEAVRIKTPAPLPEE